MLVRIWPCPAPSALFALSTSVASVLPARLLRLLRCFPHKYSLTDPALRSLPYAEALHAASGSHDITARPAPTEIRYPPCLPSLSVPEAPTTAALWSPRPAYAACPKPCPPKVLPTHFLPMLMISAYLRHLHVVREPSAIVLSLGGAALPALAARHAPSSVLLDALLVRLNAL